MKTRKKKLRLTKQKHSVTIASFTLDTSKTKGHDCVSTVAAEHRKSLKGLERRGERTKTNKYDFSSGLANFRNGHKRAKKYKKPVQRARSREN